MRPAVLLDADDLAALRTGTPLALTVGGVAFVLMAAPSDTASRRPKALTHASNGPAHRRRFTDPERRAILRQYEQVQDKMTFLKRWRFSTATISTWRKRFPAPKKRS